MILLLLVEDFNVGISHKMLNAQHACYSVYQLLIIALDLQVGLIHLFHVINHQSETLVLKHIVHNAATIQNGIHFVTQ
ncbi:hypothetical protein D3C80_1949080 [compost metagenome]